MSPVRTPLVERTKPVRVDMTAADHYALRVAAAKADMTMAAFVRQLVHNAIYPPADRKDHRSARTG